MLNLLMEISTEDLFKTFVIGGLILIALWLVAAVVIGIMRRKSGDTKMNGFLKISGLVIVGIAVVLGVIMLVIDIRQSGFVPKLAFPIIGIIVGLAGCTLLAVIGSHLKPERSSLFKKIAVVVFIIIAVICFMFIYDYYKTDIGEESSIDEVWLIVSCGVLTVIPVVIMAGSKEVLDTKSIVFGAISIALSFALSYWAPWKLPQGGSVTIASLTPLLLYSFYFGPRRGIVICFAYGLLQAIQDPYIIHPAQMLLDYPVAYCFIGFSGVLKKVIKNDFVAFGCGAVIASALRFACHVFSGVFAFADYAPVGMSPWIYSMGYNSFVFVDIAIAVGVGILLMTSKDLRKMFANSASGK